MDILIKPIVTEKLTGQAEPLNRYGFIVAKRANKIQIKKAVEEMYGVSVKEVNTLRYAGKTKYRYTKSGVLAGITSSCKKAFVTLKDGESIDFYSNI